MFKFITNKPFWVNLVAAVLFVMLLIFLTLQLLGWITKHGDYLTVPAVKGSNTEQAIKLLESKGFEVVIQDSVYTDTLQKGIVIKQLPEANSTVKINRTVFLTVNRYIPPMIVMPALEGKNLNYALEIMQRSHLLLEDTLYKPHYMKGAVIEQQYRGARIEAGSKLQWGSRVTLVIGGGLEETTKEMPDFIDLTYAEAKAQLDSLGVLVSLIANPNVKDTMNAYIIRQNPPHLDDNNQRVFIRPGMVIDIWLDAEKAIVDSILIKK